MPRSTFVAGIGFSLLLASTSFAAERPLIGDTAHGEALVKAAGGSVKVDGAWLNAASDATLIKQIANGKNGFPDLDSDNPLDHWDVLAAYRAKNTDLRDLAPSATHVYIAETVLDENAQDRLKNQAKIAGGAIVAERRVFVTYDLNGDKKGVDGNFEFVGHKDTRKRDQLKRDKKLGYVVFVPMPGFRGGAWELAVAFDKDIKITGAEIRGPGGESQAELNQAAQRFLGKGARGKYDAIKAGGAG
ncbi:MAG TPA: hypothetical protein VGF99_03820, partial [Myxococcota bacterium]